MADILKKIVKERKIQLLSEKEAVKMPSLIQAIRNSRLGIIGEIKRASPSKGQIASDDFTIDEKLEYYMKNNVVAFSVLTENHFFKGDLKDLIYIRNKYKDMPILRKDFIFDEFQIAEAKFIGASAILLIAKMLSKAKLAYLHKYANNLELEVLVEIHDEEDLKKALAVKNLALLGINNRNLNTFKTDLKITEDLIKKIPNNRNLTIISESGVNNKNDLEYLEKLGVFGVLVGESLMKGYLF